MPPHCDSMDGPVVKAAMRALDAENVDLVLPYVKADGEDEVRAAFDRTVAARRAVEAKEVADLYFCETVVRIHRRGEGAPYTGLKPAGLDVGPVIPAAERAIQSGSPDELIALLEDLLRHQVKARLDQALALHPKETARVHEVREYIEAELGFQVWSHGVLLAMQAQAHGEGEHEH